MKQLHCLQELHTKLHKRNYKRTCFCLVIPAVNPHTVIKTIIRNTCVLILFSGRKPPQTKRNNFRNLRICPPQAQSFFATIHKFLNIRTHRRIMFNSLKLNSHLYIYLFMRVNFHQTNIPSIFVGGKFHKKTKTIFSYIFFGGKLLPKRN